MTSSKSRHSDPLKSKGGAAFAVPISDSSLVPAVLRATNVVFGGCALALIDRQLKSTAECIELRVADESEVLAFLLTHPTFLKNGSWPLLTRTVTIDPRLLGKLDPDRVGGLVYPVSVVVGFLDACMGLRDWDQPLNDRWKPEELLFRGRRRPPRSRRRLNMLPQ